jgi:hypothetical protein
LLVFYQRSFCSAGPSRESRHVSITEIVAVPGSSVFLSLLWSLTWEKFACQNSLAGVFHTCMYLLLWHLCPIF